MKKSIYSLVLMDDVIRAVDEQAYRLGTSRSNLINQILAEHLSCVTPEMRMREVFDALENLVGSAMQIQQQRSASLLSMRTALEYKYRPTINYKVELERVPTENMGTLRVHIRTQSSPLIELFDRFFVYRIRFEHAQFKLRGLEYPESKLTSGCFVRGLSNRGGLTDEQAGCAIGEYISELDLAVKAFFASPEHFGETAPELEERYRKMLDRYVL